MEDTRQVFECEGCGAEYSLQTDMEIDPEFCPYCGESFDVLEWKDYENTEQEGEGTETPTTVYATSHREVRYRSRRYRIS